MAIIKQKGQRVGVFIDTQNLYYSARNMYQAKVNFGAVLEDAVAGRTLVRAIAYLIATEGGEEKTFFEALEKLGIETKSKDLQIFFGGAKKGDWDVGIAVDAIKLAPKLDAVVIVAGDGDYVPLVEYLKATTQVEIIAFSKSTSAKLIEAADDFIDLGEKPERYLLGGKTSARMNIPARLDRSGGRSDGYAPRKTFVPRRPFGTRTPRRGRAATGGAADGPKVHLDADEGEAL